MKKTMSCLIFLFICIHIFSDGYKDIPWSSEKTFVEEELNTKIEINPYYPGKDTNNPIEYHYGSHFRALKQVFFSLLSVPVLKRYGVKYFDDSLIPFKFDIYENSDKDNIVFYKNKFMAYWFTFHPKQFDDIKSTLIKKYGKGFLHEKEKYIGTDKDDLTYEYKVIQWEKNDTIIYLVTEKNTDHYQGYVYTKCSLFYFSKELFDLVKNDIQINKKAKEIENDEKELKENNLNKID